MIKALIAMSLLIVTSLFLAAAIYDWLHIRREAQASADRTAVALAQHAQRVFAAQDSALRRIEERIGDRPAETLRQDRTFHDWIRRLSDEVDYLVGVAVTDADGTAVAISTLFPSPPVSAADRSYFLALKGTSGADTFISEPIHARPTGELIVQFAHRLTLSDGRFAGVALASARPRDFSAFYRKVAVAGDSVILRRADGTILASYPADVQKAAPIALTAVEKAEDWPAVVEYRVARGRLTEDWLHDCLLLGVLSACTMAFLLLMGRYALRQSEREAAAVQAYQREAAARLQAEADALFEERLKVAQDELARATRVQSMSAVAATVAHEVNQPLAAISAFLQGARRMLASGQPDPAMLTEAISESEAQARRAGQIIHRLQRYVAKGELATEPLSLRATIGETVSLLRASGRTREMQVHTAIPDNADGVLADRVQLQQLLFNLVKNAAEATPGSIAPIEIAASHLGDRVEVSISDEGPGIAPSVMDHLFEPFRSTKADGMGVGLMISRAIARAHGGDLVASNRARGGARFTFTLASPASDAAAMAATA